MLTNISSEHPVSAAASKQTTIPLVSGTPSLSALEVERICRAFLQLVQASQKENQHGAEATAEKQI